MIHILSHQSDEIIGWVPSVLDDVHSQALQNNEETYEFTVPVTERDSDKLTSRARLLIPSEDGDFRELVIDFTEEQTYAMTKRVIAYGSFVDLRKLKVIDPQSQTGQSVRTAANYVLAGLPWEVGITDYSSIRTWTIDKHTDAYSALMAIATLFDKEIRFRVTTDGDTVTGRYVDFIDRQGLDNGKEIIFGKDLEGVTRRVLADRLVTSLHCIGPEREDGTRLEVVVEDETAYQNWNWYGNHLVQIYEPESEDQDMTLERLTSLGETELAKRISAAIEYEVTAFSLEQIFGYAHEKVRLGDSARIKDEHFHPPMYLDSRIVYVERSIFDRTQKSFKLGEVIEYTEEEVMATWRELQAKYAPKIIRSDTPPFGRANTIWIDTSQVPNVAHTWNGTTWVKATPTVAGEVGAETPEGAQDKADAAEAGAKSYADTLKAAIDQDIADVAKDVTDLNGYVDGAFEDSIISQAEAKAIEKYLNSLNAEKIDLDNRYNQVYGNASLTGTPKTNLASAKGSYNTAHTNLISSINTAIADGQTTATEKADVDSKFTSYRTALATLSQRFEEAINNIAQNKANAAESGAKTYADGLKTAIDGEISDIRGDLAALDTYVDGAFADSVISQAEAKAIEKYLNALGAEKSDLDTKYSEVYNNAALTGTPKSNLLSAKNAYNTSHSNLVTAINTAIADGKATATEKADVDTKFADYRSKLATLSQRFEQAIDAIAQAKANGAETAAKAYADGLKSQLAQDIADVSQDVSNLNTYVDGAFEDSVVSQAEAKAIEKYLNSINAEKADIDARYNEVYTNTSLTGTAKTNLSSAKSSYNTAHTNLINSINSAIADGKTTSTEKTDVDSKFTSYRSALGTLATRFDEAIDSIAQAKATAAETAAKSHADSKATAAEANAKLFAQNASNITSGIIDVGAVPLRTAPSGARIVFDGTNGFVQYNAQGQAIVQLGLNGINKFAGELQAATGTFNGSVSVSGARGSVTIKDDKVESEYNGWVTRMTGAELESFIGSITKSKINGNGLFIQNLTGDTEGGSVTVGKTNNVSHLDVFADNYIRLLANQTEQARVIGTGISMIGTSIVSTADRAWIAPTLLNGVSNYGGGYQTAGYYKDAMGFIHLRGFLTGSADGKHIFTLPAGYRPSALSNFATWSNSSVGTSRIAISTTGVVTATVSGNWLALEGISFLYGN